MLGTANAKTLFSCMLYTAILRAHPEENTFMQVYEARKNALGW